MPCGHLLGQGWPLGLCLWCLIVKLSLSHWYLGQVWCLIVSIPDLCPFSYFLYFRSEDNNPLWLSDVKMASFFEKLILVIFNSQGNPDACRFIDCSSRNYRYELCTVPGATTVTAVTLSNKYSRSSCSLGSSYGSGGNKVWVNHGCRGQFWVCYRWTVS